MAMKPTHSTLRSILALGAAILAFGCSDSGTGLTKKGTGVLVIRLTDAPFPTSEVKSVDVHIVRVDARTSVVDDATADEALSDASSSASGWKTVARPDAPIDLLSLQHGNSLALGQSALPAGTYAGFRLVIDQSKSSVTLKSGQVLDGGSTPGIKFPSAEQSGLKIQLAQPLEIVEGAETELVVDFDVANSFVMRGGTIDKNGLLFKPVVRAAITSVPITKAATVRLANATDSSLTLRLNGTALPGASDVSFGTSSACNAVSGPASAITVTRGSANMLLSGLSATTLTSGHPTTFVAYPGPIVGAVFFATLANDYVPVAGQGGFRVFNGTGLSAPIDVYVTASGAPLGTATVSSVAAGESSEFVSVAPGSWEIRAAGTGSGTTIMYLPAQALEAGRNTTLVIAPGTSSLTALRGFLVPSC
jgi:Domain of unknown function (DUF4382)